MAYRNRYHQYDDDYNDDDLVDLDFLDDLEDLENLEDLTLDDFDDILDDSVESESNDLNQKKDPSPEEADAVDLSENRKQSKPRVRIRNIEHNCEKSFAELFGVEAENYAGALIKKSELSVRVNNRLRFINVETIDELLKYSPADLMKIESFGKTSLEEITRYLERFINEYEVITIPKNDQQEAVSRTVMSDATKEFVADHIDELAKGEYQQLIDQSDDDPDRLALLQYFMEHHEEMDYSLLQLTIREPEKAVDLCGLLNRSISYLALQERIREAVECLPEYKRHNLAVNYISVYERVDAEKETLYRIYDLDHRKLEDAVWNPAVDEDNIMILLRFLKWCAFDLNKEICDAMISMFNKERYEEVIRIRSEGFTLQEAGDQLGITRERVRQIQMKITDRFERCQRKERFLLKMFADRNGDSVLTEEEISGYCGPYATSVFFLLKECASKDYKYSKALNVFIIESDGTEESRVRNFVEGLPDFFNQEQLDRLLSDAALENENIPIELYETQIAAAYKKEGEFYYRSKMRKQQMYEAVIQKYYPDGIHIYDSDELAGFRRHFIDDFGDHDLPSDRALTARLTDAGVLCARGTYKPRQKEYIPADLAEQIADFIETNESPVLPINYVYRRFQKQLNENGVDNHYYLHGILHELFDGRFYITRDYVSKSEKAFGVQPLIREYIYSIKKPVSHEDVVAHIPGVSQIVEYMATDVPEILKYHGGYMFVGNIVITEEDRAIISRYLSSKIVGDSFCNNRDVYAWLQGHCPQFLRDNYIRDQFSCFSVLEYLFNKSFQFVRPFIGALGAEIARPYERLQEYLHESDEIDVKEFAGYLKENGINNRSTLAIINENNDSVFIYSNDKLLAIHLLGIDEQVAEKVEEIVCPYVQGTMAIRDLPCFMQLPAINVAWTDWLVYSTLRKWSRKLDVGETTNKINYAVPLIAPAGMMDVSAVSVDARQQDLFAADNLDNLDDLLEDMIEWDDLENDNEY